MVELLNSVSWRVRSIRLGSHTKVRQGLSGPVPPMASEGDTGPSRPILSRMDVRVPCQRGSEVRAHAAAV